MLTKKEIRALTGYSQSKQLGDAEAWYTSAVSFHDAALVLHEAKDRVSAGFRVFAFNAALSLELILKAILAAENCSIPTTHNLRKLAKAASLSLDLDQMQTLDLLSEIIVWRGRYPSTTGEGQWDNFHDNVQEQHIIRLRRGDVHVTGVDPKKFPNKENYIKLWNTFVAKYAPKS